ncbi:hypothetical protein D3C72_2303760 [compost metagenome]
MENIELLVPTGPAGFDVHAFEQVGIALGVEDDHNLGFDAVDVLGDIHLGKACLADTGSAEHQGMSDPFAQRQTDFHLIRLDPMQQR